ncbi:hypothetical protein [Maritimibacter sp. UBA3975]|uniref:hypothetical protein n=1 Tax=Maritimibacter sp. UBA3975 TaxID=1946833 RepID=UPI000C0B2654|nr:hypothetical protein [Maritimibacter sp. UBA3975]MAM60869.1 hypothetical protein [Maritimibacter sp.]|tara:strand:+ start:20612 stop:21517 length:906 start_codon:yes stop_codon:yes gene_type:complete
MFIVPPYALTDSDLSSSNLTEDDYDEYDSGTTYADGNRVIVVADHRIYESVQGSNTGNDPSTDDGTWWVDVGATNRWKPFDQTISDQAEGSGSITYSIDLSSFIDTVTFFGLAASQVTVEVLDGGGGTVFDETQTAADASEIIDWYTFFTAEVDPEPELIFDQITGLSGYTLNITIGDGADPAPAVGQIVFGRAYRLGQTLDGTEIGIEDFSAKSEDQFGNLSVTERGFADLVNFQFSFRTDTARRVKRILSENRATPCVYFADPEIVDYGATVYGFYEDFLVPLSAGGTSLGSLDVRGLV